MIKKHQRTNPTLLTILLSICILFLQSCKTSSHQQTTSSENTFDNHSINVNGTKRSYLSYQPPSVNSNLPVVIMYHGGGGTAATSIESTNWQQTADKYGFLIVFPQGSREKPNRRASFMANPQTWNDGSGRFHAGEQNIDDVSFTKHLIDDLTKKYPIDTKRIYITGFSNGGSMAFRLGAELSDRIAAIAPFGSSGLRLVNPPPPTRAVPLLYIHGEKDKRSPPSGGNIKKSYGIDSRPPILQTVENWAKRNQCSATTNITNYKPKVQKISFPKCNKSAEVVFYLVEDLGHVWPGGNNLLPELLVGPASNSLNANEIIWHFFSQHALP